MIPEVLIADNDDAGSEVPTNTDHQENAAKHKVSGIFKVVFIGSMKRNHIKVHNPFTKIQCHVQSEHKLIKYQNVCFSEISRNTLQVQNFRNP